MNNLDSKSDGDFSPNTAIDFFIEVARKARLIVGGGIIAGVFAIAVSYLVKPTYSAATVILPPAQAQSSAGQALASLGALAGMAGGGAARSSLDQYVALLLSTTVADRMIEKFDLLTVYDVDYRQDARKQFWAGLNVAAGRREGLITIRVDDESPERAQQMAASMVAEFMRVSSDIAVTEAQQRRRFFEARLKEVREKLESAQTALQASGFAAASLKAEPRAAAESYAKLKAELTAATARLQALSATLTMQAPEVQQQSALVTSLRAQLGNIESASLPAKDADYLPRYREYKYQETLLELFSRQYEMARIDEGREGGLVQVVDVAQVPEKKSKPRRAMIGIGVSVGVGFCLLVWVLIAFHLRSSKDGQLILQQLRRIWPALKGQV